MKLSQDWMWADALGMLARAEQMQRRLFQPGASGGRQPSWEPPVDVLETPEEVLILAALPGVAAAKIEAVIDGPWLVISGERTMPPALRTAVIHRMELPQGRFERRIALPYGRYGQVTRQVVDGCLIVSLRKA
ncbi:MAG: Hsp20/alpha crystallin family protein [Phenylobacterium sp.]|uniref:Hsp20/alpha crystallin family protein n=1 Tax=Phenylobacterium sp. TaxID=1871053 RepID=UPI00391CF645